MKCFSSRPRKKYLEVEVCLDGKTIEGGKAEIDRD
jgi:hypothetical protein